jgi:hypothetical protein
LLFAGRLKLIVSPSFAAAIASRNRQLAPGQLAAFAGPSLVLCTVIVVAPAAPATNKLQSATPNNWRHRLFIKPETMVKIGFTEF